MGNRLGNIAAVAGILSLIIGVLALMRDAFDYKISILDQNVKEQIGASNKDLSKPEAEKKPEIQPSPDAIKGQFPTLSKEKPDTNVKSSLPSPRNTTIKESEDLQKEIERILLEQKLRDQREVVLREEQALKENQSKILGKWIAEKQHPLANLNLEFTADGELNPGKFRLFGGKHKYKFVTSKRIVTTGSVDSGGEMEILELSDQDLKLRHISSLGETVANYKRERN